MKLLMKILTGVLALSLVACGATGGKNSFSTTENNVSVEIAFDQAKYDTNSIVGTTVTITNNSKATIMYIQGSGSSIIPDALRYDLGGLAALFYPEAVTMDYRTEVLAPKEKLELKLNFSPYTADDGRVFFPPDKDIAFFQGEGFSPAASGTVEGVAEFTYIELPEGVDPSALMLDESAGVERIIKLPFHTTIA